MSDAWLTILALAVTAAAVRAAGPLLVGGRELSPRLIGVVDLLGPALLSALIAVEVFGGDGELVVSATLAGVLAAGAVLIGRRDALLSTIALAALVTALVRAV